MQTTNATRLLFITPFLLLAGCASEFDKCMNTELPRAEALTGLQTEREVGLDLVWVKKAQAVGEEKEVWWEQNPTPSGLPEYPSHLVENCNDEFISDLSVYELSDFFDLKHKKKLDGVSPRAVKAKECWDAAHKEYEAARAVYYASPEYIAWDDRNDQDSFRRYREIGFSFESKEEIFRHHDELSDKLETIVEPRAVFWSQTPDRFDNWMIAIDEAILTNASKITDLTEKSKELATVTCNNNGFYE